MVSGDGQHTLYFFSVDTAGNFEAERHLAINIDVTPPTSQVASLPAIESSANFQVQWSGTDAGAGTQGFDIHVSQDSGPFTRWLTNTSDASATYTGHGGSTYSFYSIAHDQVGNTENAKTSADATTKVVVSPASTTALVSPTPNAAGWNNANVAVQLSSTAAGGAQVKQISYSLTGAQTGSGTISAATGSVPISAEGTTTLTYFATDTLGSQETAKTLTVKIDKTPPVTKATASPPADAAGLNSTDVSVMLTATDTLSGSDRTEFNVDSSGWTVYSTPVVISTEGTHALQFRTTDKAGNVEPAQVLTVKIHRTVPVSGAGVVLLPQPQRLVDTRTTGGPIASGASRCFTVAGLGGIPADAAAVLLNVTTVGQTTNGWATVYPMGQAVPATSTLNFGTSEYAIANSTMTRIGTAGQVCVNVGTVGADAMANGAMVRLGSAGQLQTVPDPGTYRSAGRHSGRSVSLSQAIWADKRHSARPGSLIPNKLTTPRQRLGAKVPPRDLPFVVLFSQWRPPHE